jgi:penicillin-insensitive murein endopeptidase
MDEASLGTPWKGLIFKATKFPSNLKEAKILSRTKSKGYIYGTEVLINAIIKAAKDVAKLYPGSVLMVGDLSARFGGMTKGHRSHRNGLDGDILFYVTTKDGQRVSYPQSGMVSFDLSGIGVDVKNKDIYRFDTPRNWEFVRSLLTNPEIDIQWIFVSRALKVLLLEYAILKKESPSILIKALYILHQPGGSPPHDDHFHIRIYCPYIHRYSGCMITEPIWPWLGKQFSKLKEDSLNDTSLLEMVN